MKKLYILLATLLMVVSLGACSPSGTPDYVTQDDLDDLALRVVTLEDRFDNLIMSEGINGQVAYYENEAPEEVMYLSLAGFEYISQTETDYLDKGKFPDYIWDLGGEYITVDDLGDLLTQKYFGINSETTIGFQYKMIIIKPVDMSQDDFITRLSMMIMELSNYDFYTIDSPELYIRLNDGASSYFKVRMSLLVSDKYNLHPAIFWGGMMDTRIVGTAFNVIEVEALYNQYILDETFDGYVLPEYK